MTVAYIANKLRSSTLQSLESGTDCSVLLQAGAAAAVAANFNAPLAGLLYSVEVTRRLPSVRSNTTGGGGTWVSRRLQSLPGVPVVLAVIAAGECGQLM